MKLLKKVLLSFIALSSLEILADCLNCSNCATSCCSNRPTSGEKCSDLTNSNCLVYGKTFYSARPQDSNSARKLVGSESKIHLCCPDKLNGIADITLSYQQSFNPSDLATWFSFNGSTSMTYGNLGDGTFDINALNFGVTASGTISFNPKIQNFLANIDLFFGLDEYFCGLWTRVQVPIVYTRWDMRVCDKVMGIGTTLYDDNTVNTFPDVVTFKCLKSAWASEKSVGNTTSTVACGFGGIPSLTSGKLNGRLTDTTVAGIHFDVGRDIKCKKGHLGGFFHLVIPVGTTPSSYYLFSAVAGANKSWQVGFGLDAAYELWSDNCERNLSFYLDATISHLFDSQQKRILGLKNKTTGKTNPGSAWLVLKKYSGIRTLDHLTPMVRAESILNCDVKIGASIMSDVTMMLQFDSCNWSLGAGWNFWLRTREKMKERCCTIPNSKYGISNLAHGETTFASQGTFATASLSTISETLGIESTTAPSNDGEGTNDYPIFLRDSDVDICTALHPKAFSNKVFGFVGYTWNDRDWKPFLSVYGGAEKGNKNKAVDMWEVGVKGGIQF